MPVQWVQMVQVEVAPSPDGVVYSTAPLVGESSTGTRFFLKGPDLQTVVAEAIAYALASAIGLSVPDWALTRIDDKIYFASAAAPIYSGVDALLRTRPAANEAFWSTCLAFDMWLANPDRNPGNLVARPDRGRKVEFQAIDFEKSRLLAGQSVFLLNTLPASNFRPIGSLAGTRAPGAAITQAASKIAVAADATVSRIFSDLRSEPVLAPALSDGLAWNLRKRAEQLVQLCREAYDA